METRLFTLIQFQYVEYSGGWDDIIIGKYYYLNPGEDTTFDFYTGEEDEDGDSIYTDRDCIRVHISIDSLVDNDYAIYVSKSDVMYTTIELELPVDENGYPIFKAA